MNTITIQPEDLLAEAGFKKLALRQKALSLGTKFIAQAHVSKFARQLKTQHKQFDFSELADYEPNGTEIIPTSELEKVRDIRKQNIFDKIVVVGTKKEERKRLRREVDPIVVGLILNEVELNQVNRNLNNVRNYDWYFIAGWK